jgi:uncharacterized protein (TIGR02996 family)
VTHDGFIQSIIEDPEDDTPRLVYADWLEEYGCPERAEFIRVQIALDRLPTGDPSWASLRTREAELLDCHQREWVGPLRSLLTRWMFRRGFLDEVAVPAGLLNGQRDSVWPATVRRVGVDLDGFEALRSLLDLVPEPVARENVVLPLWLRGPTLMLAMVDPGDRETLARLRLILNREIEPVAATRAELVEAINRHYIASETGWLGSMLAEWTETALEFTDEVEMVPPPARRSGPPPTYSPEPCEPG